MNTSQRVDGVHWAPPFPLVFLAAISLLLAGAIFGFFYAYSVSVMWGLDAADPKSAIAAMQGINRVVRNAAFAPAFFGTPLVLLVSALLAYFAASHRAAFLFAVAAATYFGGALLPTFLVNVPMNEALAVQAVPDGIEEAAEFWGKYSARWTVWNHIRMAMSGVALLFTGGAILALGRTEGV
jgi:uncharacterized membrane protein